MRRDPSVIPLQVQDPVPLMERITRPIVWNRITTGVRIQDLTSDLFNQCIDLIEEYNLLGEPIARGTMIYYDPDTKDEYLNLIRYWMKDNTSLVAVEEGTGTVVGVLVGRINLKLSRTRTMSKFANGRKLTTIVDLPEASRTERKTSEKRDLKVEAVDPKEPEDQIQEEKNLVMQNYLDSLRWSCEEIDYELNEVMMIEKWLMRVMLENLKAELWQAQNQIKIPQKKTMPMMLEEGETGSEETLVEMPLVYDVSPEDVSTEWRYPPDSVEEWAEEEAEEDEGPVVVGQDVVKKRTIGWNVLDGTEGLGTVGTMVEGSKAMEEFRNKCANLHFKGSYRLFAHWRCVPQVYSRRGVKKRRKKRSKNKRKDEIVKENHSGSEVTETPAPVGYELSDGEPGKIYKTETLQRTQDFKHHVLKPTDIYEKYNVDGYYRVYLICVAPEYKNDAVGLELLNSALSLARSMGLEVVTGIFTSAICQSIAHSLGFQVENQVFYENWKVNKKPIFEYTGESNFSAAHMTIKLEAAKVEAAPLPTAPEQAGPPRRKPKTKKSKK